MESWLIVALLVVVIAMGVLIVRRMWPIKLDISYLPLSKSKTDMGLKFDAENGDTRHAVGKIGELVTAMLFANKGWRQLPSQTTGMQQTDGLFIKPRKSGKYFDIAFVETKASFQGDPKGNYEDTMSVDELLSNLVKYQETDFDEAQKFMPKKTATALKAALKRKSVFINMYLYTHNFAAGECCVYQLNRDGSVGTILKNRHNAEEYKALLQALTISLGRLLKLTNKEIDATHAAMQFHTEFPTLRETNAH